MKTSVEFQDVRIMAFNEYLARWMVDARQPSFQAFGRAPRKPSSVGGITASMKKRA
jgi:hypothetical protein